MTRDQIKALKVGDELNCGLFRDGTRHGHIVEISEHCGSALLEDDYGNEFVIVLVGSYATYHCHLVKPATDRPEAQLALPSVTGPCVGTEQGGTARSA